MQEQIDHLQRAEEILQLPNIHEPYWLRVLQAVLQRLLSNNGKLPFLVSSCVGELLRGLRTWQCTNNKTSGRTYGGSPLSFVQVAMTYLAPLERKVSICHICFATNIRLHKRTRTGRNVDRK